MSFKTDSRRFPFWQCFTIRMFFKYFCICHFFIVEKCILESDVMRYLIWFHANYLFQDFSITDEKAHSVMLACKKLTFIPHCL